MKATASAVPRLPGLDFIRAAAIAWVMLYHASVFGLTSQSHWLVRFGWMGVDLFFVLSGFLIAEQFLRPLSRGLKPSYSRFFGRRLLRTIPAYLAVVAVYFCIPIVRDQQDIQPLWQFLTFTENLFIDISTPKAFSQVWALCVEEQFYLAFPVAVAFISFRPSSAKTMAAIVSLLILGMAIRGYVWLHSVASIPFDLTAQPQPRAFMQLIYYPTWTRLDGFLMGIIAAVVRNFRPATWNMLTARANLILGLGLSGIVASTFFFGGYVTGFWASVFAYPLLSASIALVVIAATDNSCLIGRYALPGVATLATGAYSLYLSHKAVFHFAQMATSHFPAEEKWAAFPLALLGALLAGAGLYWTVERPFLKIRDRLEGPSRSSLATAPSADRAPIHARSCGAPDPFVDADEFQRVGAGTEKAFDTELTQRQAAKR